MNNRVDGKRNYIDVLILCLCVFSGCAIMFALENYGANSKDELFQSICVRRYEESPLGLLSFRIGNLWTSIFGFSLLNLRILTSILLLLAIAVSTFYSYKITRKLKLSGILFLLGCIFLRAGTFSIYNWDTGTYLFDAFAICLLLSIIDKPSLLNLIGLGVTAALMTLGRAPSAIFLPLSTLMVFLSCRKRLSQVETFKLCAVIVISWLAAMTILTALILGSPFNYTEAFFNHNVITGHSPFSEHRYLAKRFVDMTAALPNIWFYGIVCLILSVILPRLRRLYSIPILAAWVIFCIITAYSNTEKNHNLLIYFGIDTPVSLGLLIAVPIFRLFNKNSSSNLGTLKLKLWSCFILLISVSFGSDAYMQRMTTGFLIPIIAGLLWEYRNNEFHVFLKYSLGITLITFGMMLASHLANLAYAYRNVPISKKYPYSGIRADSMCHLETIRAEDAINKVRSEGIPYLYLGDHLAAELSFGPDEGLSFQNYHNTLTNSEQWLRYKKGLIDKIDAVVYVPGINKYKFDGIIADLKSEGFIKSEKIGKAMILYRNHRKLPDKKYMKVN